MEVFADRLKEAMQQANVTAAQLAKQTGIGRSSISQWLSHKYVAKHDKVVALATVLNVSPDWLLGTTENAATPVSEAVPIPVAVTPTSTVDPELVSLWDQLNSDQQSKLIKKARKLIAKSKDQSVSKHKKDKKKKKHKKRK